MSGGILYAFEQCTLESKICLFVLFIASIFSWSVMWAKFRMVILAQKVSKEFLKNFRNGTKPITLYAQQAVFRGSPLYAIYLAGCSELSFQKTSSNEVDDTFLERFATSKKISPVAMDSVRSAMVRAVGESALKLEDKMVMLATAVSGAPFIGLLGTVWGVMDTFSGIAMSGSANLQAMAPGVSGALVTTVTGLLVAIPAMFGYNFLVATIRAMTVEMDNFAAELAANIEHYYLETDSSKR